MSKPVGPSAYAFLLVLSFPAVLPLAAEPMIVTITIENMECIHISREEAIPIFGSNDRDEIYIQTAGEAAGGEVLEHLPRFVGADDYYEFKAGWTGESRGWTNKDQIKRGKPLIWSGVLESGQKASITIHIGEQDNKDLANLQDLLA